MNRTERLVFGILLIILGLMLEIVLLTAGIVADDISARQWTFGAMLAVVGFCCIMEGSSQLDKSVEF